MEQINLSTKIDKKVICEQGVNGLKIEVIQPKEGEPFLKSAAKSKRMYFDNDNGIVRILFKEGDEVVDNYTLDELFELLQNNNF